LYIFDKVMRVTGGGIHPCYWRGKWSDVSHCQGVLRSSRENNTTNELCCIMQNRRFLAAFLREKRNNLNHDTASMSAVSDQSLAQCTRNSASAKDQFCTHDRSMALHDAYTNKNYSKSTT
jgi:hypothetical protein